MSNDIFVLLKIGQTFAYNSVFAVHCVRDARQTFPNFLTSPRKDEPLNSVNMPSAQTTAPRKLMSGRGLH